MPVNKLKGLNALILKLSINLHSSNHFTSVCIFYLIAAEQLEPLEYLQQ